MSKPVPPHWSLPKGYPTPRTESEALAMAADPTIRPEALSMVTEIDVEPRAGRNLEAIQARHAARTRLLSAALAAPSLSIPVLAWLLDKHCRDINGDPVVIEDDPARALIGNISVTLWTFADEGWMRALSPRGLCGLARNSTARNGLWRQIALGALQNTERSGILTDALVELLNHGTQAQRDEMRVYMKNS